MFRKPRGNEKDSRNNTWIEKFRDQSHLYLSFWYSIGANDKMAKLPKKR
jgi:hypothetical protein